MFIVGVFVGVCPSNIIYFFFFKECRELPQSLLRKTPSLNRERMISMAEWLTWYCYFTHFFSCIAAQCKHKRIWGLCNAVQQDLKFDFWKSPKNRIKCLCVEILDKILMLCQIFIYLFIMHLCPDFISNQAQR